MKKMLPRILGAGTFESEKHYNNVNVSDRRRVENFEIELFTKDGGISVINGEENKISRGRLLVSKPGDLRYSHLHFSCKFIHFEVTDEKTYRLLSAFPSFINADCYLEFSHLFDRIFEIFISDGEFNDVYGAAALYELICKIDNLQYAPVHHSLSKSTADAVWAAVEFMNNNYQNHITVNDIAVASGLSVSYFYKSFSEIVGVTPISHLVRIRIAAAKRLLLTTDDILDIVAEKSGFCSTTYFCTCFKKSVGVSPSRYRKTAKYVLFSEN